MWFDTILPSIQNDLLFIIFSKTTNIFGLLYSMIELSKILIICFHLFRLCRKSQLIFSQLNYNFVIHCVKLKLNCFWGDFKTIFPEYHFQKKKIA